MKSITMTIFFFFFFFLESLESDSLVASMQLTRKEMHHIQDQLRIATSAFFWHPPGQCLLFRPHGEQNAAEIKMHQVRPA